MLLRTLVAALLPVQALGLVVSRDSNQWQAPGPNDRRSPCPFLNTASNHGFLPRDGFNVSHQQIFDGFKAALNFESSALLAAVTLGQTTSTTGHPSTFHMDDLNVHNLFEHDASLSRNDSYFGPAIKLEQSIWAQTLTHFPDPYISLSQAKAALEARIAESKATNPEHVFGALAQAVVDIETAVYTFGTGGGVNGGANREWLKVIFREFLPLWWTAVVLLMIANGLLVLTTEEERFPYELGFHRFEQVTTGEMVDQFIANIKAAPPVQQ
ncbi:hypothetical protein PpBr36_03892 [Pyricularia pennisetigena]|uniref:hypothetical protein n=1 Tax=Pyricularia pennisetigena TaxID=1578925 RepID=UPI001154EEAE|nr:hypothetical protein PpBr36_03892 [Pyricularia pennisetigena]TLS30808.1 hypothetical protein PpBr36_03892 [Pyricularia pennisetigena]